MSEESNAALVPFNKLDAEMAELKKEHAVVPDFKTKEGYEVGKKSLKEGRDIKKRVKDLHAIKKAEITKVIKLLDDKRDDLNDALDDIFSPIQKARKEEDSRQEQIKVEKAEAKAKRENEIKARIDDMKESYVNAVSKTSQEVMQLIDTFKAADISEELFGDDVEIARSIHSALTSKLQTLYDSKKEQEEESARIKKESEELRIKQEAQKAEDERRAEEQRVKDEAEQKRIKEENAKLKAENESLQAERKKLDDERAVIEAEKKKIEDDKIKAKEEEERRIKEEADRKAEEERLKKEAEENAEFDRKFVEDQKERDRLKKIEREEAEKLAKEEAKERYEQLMTDLVHILTANPEPHDGAASIVVEAEGRNIPYLRVIWTEK